MKCPSIFPTEPERLEALSAYGLDSEHQLPSLDPVVRIAARMFGMPVAAVNLIGSDHVFFAASTGIDEAVDMRRDVSFCAHAINQHDVMVVPDARLDERFHDNPLVTGSANLRFYAGAPLLAPDGHALGALCVIDSRPHDDFTDDDRERLRELAKMAADRMELRRIEVSPEHSRPAFDDFARNAPNPLIAFDAGAKLIGCNSAAAALLGRSPTQGLGETVDTLLPERDRAAFRDLLARAVAQGSLEGLDVPKDIVGLRSDGVELLLGLTLFMHREAAGVTFSAHLQDCTERRERENALRRMASTDGLTGLANRAGFFRRVEDTLTRPLPAAVVMIDLDGFKDVNDTLGHAIGDNILQEVGHRLEAVAGMQGFAARIGGDEFALLLAGTGDPESAAMVAHIVLRAIEMPIVADGHEVRVAASCGIAVAPQQADEALELIGNADLALFKAKSIGRAQCFTYQPALRMEAVARRLYSMELHRAAHAGEFLLFYQPQVRLYDGALTGAEALIRWLHPERGLLSPAAFLPALEGGPLAATVGAWALEEACAQAAYWRRNGAPDFRMGVNLFGAQFRVGDLAAQVQAALDKHGLPPEALELEVTENIVLDHDDLVLDTLQRVRALGVGVSFDDFGTGYASLSLLKRYPLTRIKIDRSFVEGMLESERDASVVRAILDITRSFELDSIAEGIERDVQRIRLFREGCVHGQGYLFGQALSAEQFSRAFGLVGGSRTSNG